MTSMTFETWFAQLHPQIPIRSVQAVLSLSGEGSTVPFMARYRKEQTGNLDEVQIQSSLDAKEKWDELIKRQAFIVAEIEKQKKLTPELKEKILATFKSEELEDIYLPFKLKRKTKAAQAKEAGLEPLADWIWNCGHGLETPQEGQTLEKYALAFLNPEADIKEAPEAIAGATDILIERLSETQRLRQLVRETYFQKGFARSSKGAKALPHSKFENYFDYQEKVESLLQPQNSHRYLALRRGWMEEELKLGFGGQLNEEGKDGGFEDSLLASFEAEACSVKSVSADLATVLKKAARLAFKGHVVPSIDAEVHKALKDVADEAAIKVFAENVRKLLMAAPFGPKAVLGVDPGIRTGCKLAVVDASGKYVANTVMHLQSEREQEKAAEALKKIVGEFKIKAVAVGNGTASRETESFVRKAVGPDAIVAVVSESGASVYSASETAREEFPELDVTVRGAISIARRLQDPLAELVKVDPKAIGVGQYQHDVAQPALKKGLELVVDSCVNQVGVNLNTASPYVLSRVAGIGEGLAKAIVEFRKKKGLFRSRRDLLDVPRFSQKAFEQAAGFLRIPEAENPLDNTAVHPERYPVLESVSQKIGKPLKECMGAGVSLIKANRAIVEELEKEVGKFTFQDILTELEKPGRDPRDQFIAFQFRDDIHEVKDLKPGMMCPGIVTNVTNFGAFVDIGVHQDGLVHISQLADRFVKEPREVVSPGDRVHARVLEINLDKNQIALSLRAQGGAGERPATPPKFNDARRVPVAPKPAVNSPFAALAGMRDQFKGKK